MAEVVTAFDIVFVLQVHAIVHRRMRIRRHCACVVSHAHERMCGHVHEVGRRRFEVHLSQTHRAHERAFGVQ